MCNRPEDIERINKQRLGLFSIVIKDSGKLKEEYVPSKYEVIMQAGAACTDKRIADINDHDNFFQSISEKNLRYGELTAIYWIWKNCHAEYVGTCHYRRKFDISDDVLDEYMDEGVDAVLRRLEYSTLGIKEQYIKSGYKYDWDEMMDIIHSRIPDFYEFIKSNENRKSWRTCCIGIYKKSVFDEMCSTLFPLLFEFESRRKEKKDRYQKRDIAYLYERLIFFYFEYKKDIYKYKEVDVKLLNSEEMSIDINLKMEEDGSLQNLIKEMLFEYRLSEMAQGINALAWKTQKINSIKNIINIFEVERQTESYTWLDYLPDANILDNVLFWHDSMAYFITQMLINGEVGIGDDFAAFVKMSNTSFTAILMIMEFLGMNSSSQFEKMADIFVSKGLDLYVMRFMYKAYKAGNGSKAIKDKANEYLSNKGIEQKLDW